MLALSTSKQMSLIIRIRSTHRISIANTKRQAIFHNNRHYFASSLKQKPNKVTDSSPSPSSPPPSTNNSSGRNWKPFAILGFGFYLGLCIFKDGSRSPERDGSGYFKELKESFQGTSGPK